MPPSNRSPHRGNVWLPHVIFYGIEIGAIAIAALLIFTDADPRLSSKLQDDTNIYGDNPGLSFRPMADQDSGMPASIISYGVNDRESHLPWVNSLTNFLEAYKTPGLVPSRSRGIYNCNFNNPPPPWGVCDVDVRNFGDCIAENYYNYHRQAPCVFLRFNSPPGWKPEFYNDTASLPDAMPSHLKSYIMKVAKEKPRNVLNTVWVSCDGENPADKEFIGPIVFYPQQGFPGYYLMNTDVEGYLSPLVAVRFERPMYGPLINIKCKAWARNIKHDNDSALGGVEFGLMLK